MISGIFSSEQGRARKEAAHWLALADKVWNYRRDLLTEVLASDLLSARAELKRARTDRVDVPKLRLAIKNLERALGRTGGVFYPRSSWQDNVEFFFVAAIFIIGLRVFVVQPFKIPTNSMWPSYFGMTGEVFRTPADEPSLPVRAARFVLFGAFPQRVEAPVAGRVRIPVRVLPPGPATGGRRVMLLPPQLVPDRRWLVFPSVSRRYTLGVGGQTVTYNVPAEFEVDRVYAEAFFPSARNLEEGVLAAVQRGGFQAIGLAAGPRGTGDLWVDTEKSVDAGGRVLAFDVMTGDQLFVDRLSYHFVRPEVGEGFVFRTRTIAGLRRPDGSADDSYYIKRLVGTPGDTLEIRGAGLWRNAAPITGATAFGYNAARERGYTGYVALENLAPGRTVTVGANQFYVLGDNSGASLDSRSWGFVPEKEVVGRPLFIYFPFSRRWGPAR